MARAIWHELQCSCRSSPCLFLYATGKGMEMTCSYTAIYCNTLQYTATLKKRPRSHGPFLPLCVAVYYSVLQYVAVTVYHVLKWHTEKGMEMTCSYTAIHCNTLQHTENGMEMTCSYTAIYCNTLQYTATLKKRQEDDIHIALIHLCAAMHEHDEVHAEIRNNYLITKFAT